MKKAAKVPCAACGHPLSAVVDSRGALRLRVCDGCGVGYLTEERLVRLVKRGARRIAPQDIALRRSP